MNTNDRQLEFLSSVDAVLAELGAALSVARVRTPAYAYPTWYGVLKVEPFLGKLAPKIYSRFANPKWVQELPGEFNRNNGRWNHFLWLGWNSDFEPGMAIFAQRLEAIALSCDRESRIANPFRRGDGSVMRFHKSPAGDGWVLITTADGQLWSQSLDHFHKAKRPRLRVVAPWEFGATVRRRCVDWRKCGEKRRVLNEHGQTFFFRRSE